MARRQARILRSQSLLVNSCTMIVVVTIYYLVTFTTSFNYRTNILDHWWFSLAFCYLVLLYFLSLLLSVLELPCLSVGKEEQETKSQEAPIPCPRWRHPTGQSTHSASSHLVEGEQGPDNLWLKALLSLLLTLLVLAPSIVGIVLFKTLPDDDYHLLQVLHSPSLGII